MKNQSNMLLQCVFFTKEITFTTNLKLLTMKDDAKHELELKS